MTIPTHYKHCPACPSGGDFQNVDVAQFVEQRSPKPPVAGSIPDVHATIKARIKKNTMVYSLSQAMNWFLSHSSGTVICVKGEKQKECASYPEAKAFYES